MPGAIRRSSGGRLQRRVDEPLAGAETYTDGLWAIARGIFAKVGVTVDEIRTADHEISRRAVARHAGARVGTAMSSPTSTSGSRGPAHILIIAGPIWLADQSLRIPARSSSGWYDTR